MSVPRLAPPADAWLSLGPASRYLGVDPDTLRRWADEGRVDVYLTPGGHRRFDRPALERVLARRPAAAAGRLAGLGATPDGLSAAYRRRYSAVRGPERRIAGAVAGPDRELFRRDGRDLVAALLAHLDADDAAGRATAAAAAEHLVDDLARRLALAGTSLTDAAALFVAARRPFLAELAVLGRRRSLDAERLSRIYEAASSLLDRLLLRLIDTHQAVSSRPGDAGPRT